MKFREVELKEKMKMILGKDEIGNDELMKKFKGKSNIILHTAAPGSPFGVIEKLNPTEDEIYLAGMVVAKYSQNWRDNKKNVRIDVFTGKTISKPKSYKPGTWRVKKKKTIVIEKEDIINFEKLTKNATKPDPNRKKRNN